MASICFYFQMHQPQRLRHYSVFDSKQNYFDDVGNRQVLQKVTRKCYEPFTALLKQLIERTDGEFCISLSITGSLIEQFRKSEPTMIDRLVALSETGRCELLSETTHHSLAFFYNRDEFAAQVESHAMLMEDLFDQRPSVFRNTELVYNNDLADFVAKQTRCRGILAEGVDELLAGRSPNNLYRPPNQPDLALLLRNYKLSDDIAFRFSDKGWSDYPLTAEKFVSWLATGGDVVNLFMDIETFGEHQWKDTGIFDFFKHLPRVAMQAGHRFMTVGETIDEYEPIGDYDAPDTTSWADTERDLSAWVGNAMQDEAIRKLFDLTAKIKASGDASLLADWRRMTTSDHFYYMCTKYESDGEVHRYFNPYESPYDSYINYMNVLENLASRVK